jgi:hypothetical protein
MAKRKAKPLPDYVRTGGLVGDGSMQMMEDYNAAGAGVDESRVRNCGPNPNEDLLDGMPSLPGAED